MMPILDLQRRIAEVGRLRAGERDDGRPVKLDTWRFTSAHRGLIESAAKLYGGTPAQWTSPAGPEWEVITESDTLNVIVPPADMSFSQWYETWSGGGCQRRCDGIREVIGDRPCMCDPEERDCKPTTRLSVILPELPGFGVWRVESKGFYAASELSAAVDLIQQVQQRGLVPAELRLVERVIKRPGQPTRKFKVPTLDAKLSAAALMAATSTQMLGSGPVGGEMAAALDQGNVEQTALEAGFTPVGLDESDAPPVVAQVATRPKRRNTSKEQVPRTGRAPRTAAQAAAGERAGDAPAVWRMNDAQRAKLMATCGDAKIEDALRYDITRLITEDRTHSSRELTRVEFEALLFIAQAIGEMKIAVSYDQEGALHLAKDNGSAVDLAALIGHFEASS